MVVLPALNKVINQAVSKQRLPPKFLPPPPLRSSDLRVIIHEISVALMAYSPCPQLLSPLLSFVFFFNPSFLLDSDCIIIVI